MSTPMTKIQGKARLAAVAAFAAASAAALALPANAMPIPDPLPSVNMERLLLAAQLDPHRTDSDVTPGAADSVRAVEAQLDRLNYLAPGAVDGHWGSLTASAWRQWEQDHSPSGPAHRNHLPGLGELQEIGSGRFTLNHKVDIGDRVNFSNSAGSHTVSQRTMAMFKEAERLSNDMTITQGSYNLGVTESAGVHDGGGAIDVRTWDAPAKSDERVAALRKVGFAAWHRTRAQGFSEDHIHAVAINDYQQSWDAHYDECQVFEFKFYEAGSGGICNEKDSSANSRNLTTWEEYKRAN
jgi:peptidoglycan hydrolase-like protein with peptidoglycan-binding domain